MTKPMWFSLALNTLALADCIVSIILGWSVAAVILVACIFASYVVMLLASRNAS